MTPRSRTLLGSAALALALGTISAHAQTPAAPPASTPPGATTTPPAAAKPSTAPADKMATAKPAMKHAKAMPAKSMPMKGSQTASAQDPQVDALNNQSLMSAQKGTNFVPSATAPAAPAPMTKGKTMPMKKGSSS